MTRDICNAIGCHTKIGRDHVFCAKHLVMVESDTRTILGRAFRPTKRHQSFLFSETLQRAQREIIYFQTEGHPVPRDQPFQWDDDKVEIL